MQKRGTPIDKPPIFGSKPLDLYKLYLMVVESKGLLKVITKKLWPQIAKKLAISSKIVCPTTRLRRYYIQLLYPFEIHKEGFSDDSQTREILGPTEMLRKRQSPTDNNDDNAEQAHENDDYEVEQEEELPKQSQKKRLAPTSNDDDNVSHSNDLKTPNEEYNNTNEISVHINVNGLSYEGVLRVTPIYESKQYDINFSTAGFITS